MRGFVLALAVCLLVGCDSLAQTGYPVVTPEKRPMEARITNGLNPDLEAKVKELDARVKTLEEWAQKRGSRY